MRTHRSLCPLRGAARQYNMDSIRLPALWSGGGLFVLNQEIEMCLWGPGHGRRWLLKWVYCWWRSSLWFCFNSLMWSPHPPSPSSSPLVIKKTSVTPEGTAPEWSARSGGGSVHSQRAAGPIAVRRLSPGSLREISIWTQLCAIDQPSLLAFGSANQNRKDVVQIFPLCRYYADIAEYTPVPGFVM